MVEVDEPEEQAAVRAGLAAAEQQLAAAQQAVLGMRSKIAELKTYKVEPSCAAVLQAAFVLLGTEPSEVAEWSELRRRLTPEFFTALTGFDAGENAPSGQHQRRAEQLMEGMEEEQVQQSSEALLAVFHWVTAGRKLLAEAAGLRAALQELAGKVSEELTGDFYADYEQTCGELELAPHPDLLPRAQCQRQRRLDAPEPDPKAKAPESAELPEEQQCRALQVRGRRLDTNSVVAALRCLPKCETCTQLHLWSAELAPQGLDALVTALPATAITSLSMDWSIGPNKVRGSLLAQLVSSDAGSKLESLSLRANGLTAKEVQALADGLLTNTTLSSLDLSNNGLSDEAAAPLAAVLKQEDSALASRN